MTMMRRVFVCTPLITSWIVLLTVTSVASQGCSPGLFGQGCKYADLLSTHSTASTPQVLRDGDHDTCMNETDLESVTLSLTQAFPFTWLRLWIKDKDLVMLLTLNVTLHGSIDGETVMCNNMRKKPVYENVLDINCDGDVAVQSLTVSGQGVNTLCTASFSGGSVCREPPPGNGCDPACHGCRVCESNSGVCSVCNPGVTGIYCDLDCVTGKYGATCTETCSANCKTKECNSSDGTCTKGCNNGYYDKKCNKNCSKNCKGDTCKQDGGQCEKGCEIGYRGDKCDDTCSRGWYGLECKESCPSKCSSGYCHHVSGMCTYGCERGYRGRFCENACREGTYGNSCSGTCSSTCRSKLCNHVNGTCTDGCLDGFFGDTCDKECLTGTYGPNCNMTCSATCYINVTHVHSCHHQTGVCLQGCIKGYTGDQCEIKLPDDSTSNVAGVGVTVTVLVCVIIALIAVYLCKKRGYLKKRAPQPTKPTTAQQQKPSGRDGNLRQEQDDEHYYESYGGAKAMTASASQVTAAETMEEETEYENADVGHYEDIIEMESLDGRGLYENNTYGLVTATAEEISKRVKGKGYQPTPLAMMMLKLPSQK